MASQARRASLAQLGRKANRDQQDSEASLALLGTLDSLALSVLLATLVLLEVVDSKDQLEQRDRLDFPVPLVILVRLAVQEQQVTAADTTAQPIYKSLALLTLVIAFQSHVITIHCSLQLQP